MTILEMVKTLLGLTDDSKDSLLNLLINNATEFAKSYTHNDNVDSLKGCIARIAVYDYNRIGTEGIDGESYSGVSFNYSADYPEGVLKPLRSYRKVVVIK